MSLLNPSLPPGYIYTPYYCEENIYLLVESFLNDQSISDNWETYAVFLSNHTKTVALWNQKVSRDPDYPVVWDYHCILLLKSKVNTPSHGDDESSWIFDYDSRLAMPCPLKGKLAAFFSRSCSPATHPTIIHQSISRLRWELVYFSHNSTINFKGRYVLGTES